MSEILEVGKNEGHDEPFSEYDYQSFLPYINSFQHDEVIHINNPMRLYLRVLYMYKEHSSKLMVKPLWQEHQL